MAIGYQSCGLMLESPVVNNYLCMSSHLSMSFIFLMFDQIYSRNLSYLEILKLKFLRQEEGLLLIWGHHRLHSKFSDSVGYKMEPSLKCMYTYMHTNTHAYINAKYFFKTFFQIRGSSTLDYRKFYRLQNKQSKK